MASKFGTSLDMRVGRARRTRKSRSGLCAMSEKQVQAYLVARDVVRRLRRTCSLVPTPDRFTALGHRMQATQHRDLGNP